MPPVNSLTRDMLVARTKTQHFLEVKRLNAWGLGLTDVSLLAECQNLEVLSLSVNKLSDLSVFGTLGKLKELYLRKNVISELEQLLHLKNIPELSTLWIGENPFTAMFRSEGEYRATVLGVLPNLLKLDNTDVTPEEVQYGQALLSGAVRPVMQEVQAHAVSATDTELMRDFENLHLSHSSPPEDPLPRGRSKQEVLERRSSLASDKEQTLSLKVEPSVGGLSQLPEISASSGAGNHTQRLYEAAREREEAVLRKEPSRNGRDPPLAVEFADAPLSRSRVNPSSSLVRTGARSNVLTACLALVPELEPKELEVLGAVVARLQGVDQLSAGS